MYFDQRRNERLNLEGAKTYKSFYEINLIVYLYIFFDSGNKFSRYLTMYT